MKNQIRTKTNRRKIFVIYSLLLVLPVLAGIVSMKYFTENSREISYDLRNTQGKVAGSFDENTKDLTKELPLLPSSEIYSLDTTNNSINMTLTTRIPEDQVHSFYQDFFFVNGWEQKEDGTYKKDNKTIKVEISAEIVKINITETPQVNKIVN